MMGFYDDLVNGLLGMIGRGREYANPKQMADACGVAPIQLSRYLKRERSKYVKSLARLIDGVGARLIFPGEQTCFSEEFMPVPKVLAKPSGGTGGLETDASVENYYAFRTEWLHAKGQPASMRLMSVTGESMAPRIEDGDMVLVDESQTDLYDGRIYVVRIDQEIVIKRIGKLPGKVLLMSDNPDAEPRRIELDLSDESVDWAPVGRVLYVSKDLK